METYLQLPFVLEIAQLVSINQEHVDRAHKEANNGAMMGRLICPVATGAALLFNSTQSGVLSYHWQVRLAERRKEGLACLIYPGRIQFTPFIVSVSWQKDSATAAN